MNDIEEVKLTTLSEFEVDYSFDVYEPQLALGKHSCWVLQERSYWFNNTTWSRIWIWRVWAASGNRNLQNSDGATWSSFCQQSWLWGRFVNFCLVRQSAMCASQKFTGKGMRDEITLIQSDVAKIEKVTKTIEARWVNDYHACKCCRDLEHEKRKLYLWTR